MGILQRAEQRGGLTSSERDELEETVEELLQQRADLLEALVLMTPAHGFPKCDHRCASIAPTPEDDPRCDCGLEELRDNAEIARAAIAKAKEPK